MSFPLNLRDQWMVLWWSGAVSRATTIASLNGIAHWSLGVGRVMSNGCRAAALSSVVMASAEGQTRSICRSLS
jgi:hypothetical protein